MPLEARAWIGMSRIKARSTAASCGPKTLRGIGKLYLSRAPSALFSSAHAFRPGRGAVGVAMFEPSRAQGASLGVKPSPVHGSPVSPLRVWESSLLDPAGIDSLVDRHRQHRTPFRFAGSSRWAGRIGESGEGVRSEKLSAPSCSSEESGQGRKPPPPRRWGGPVRTTRDDAKALPSIEPGAMCEQGRPIVLCCRPDAVRRRPGQNPLGALSTGPALSATGPGLTLYRTRAGQPLASPFDAAAVAR